MNTSKYRDMRILLFFDLPMKTKKEIKSYSKFRKQLLNDGYIMVQYSVYSRYCRNHANLQKHLHRLNSWIPSNGEIRVLTVTERQYLDMYIINGEFNHIEKNISSDPIVEV